MGACCLLLWLLSVGHHWGAISLTNMAPRKYMSVSVSTRNSAGRLLAYLSCVALRGLGEMFHISVLMEEHSKGKGATHLLASVRGQPDVSLRTPSTEEAPENLRRCRNGSGWRPGTTVDRAANEHTGTPSSLWSSRVWRMLRSRRGKL